MTGLGLLFAFVVLVLAFWLLLFLMGFMIPYAATLFMIEKISPRTIEKITGYKYPEEEEEEA